LGGRAVIAAEVEEIVDPVMGGEEALGLARRLEPLHLPLASPGRLMGVLRSIVLGLPPWCGGDRSEYHAAARMVIASMLARASTGVR